MPMHRVALIGLGMAARPHVQSLRDLAERAEIAAVFSPDPQRRAAFAAAHGLAAADSLEAILADERIDTVGLLTPPGTHLALVEVCANAGKQIVLEKPLEITLERSEALAAAGDKAGVTIAVCLQQRFRQAAERLKDVLAAGRLGRIVSCSTQIPLWRPQSYYDQQGRGTKARDGGGVLITQGIHTLDLMLSLAGPVAELCGYALTATHRMECEDLACFAVKYADGAIGTIAATTSAFPGSGETISFLGTNGSAVLSGGGLAVRYLDGGAEYFAEAKAAGGVGADPMDFPHDFHRAVWADFFDAVEQRRPPRVSAAEALKVHRLIDAMTRAAAGGGTVKVAR
jgi:UDP-N-acetyl-2-amino-2-deoxyglucuronate dehydrogenase